MRRLGIALVVVLVVLLGAGRWLRVHHHEDGQNAEAAVTTPNNSDYYLRDATIYQFGDDGSLSYRAHAVKALHFPDKSAQLTNIDVHYVKNTATYWDLHANHGQMPSGQRSVYLYDGVTGHHPRAGGQTVRFVTSHAWVYPDRNLITSDAHVKAYEPGHVVTGDGMHIDLDTDTLNLLNNVHVTYAP